MEYLGSLKLNLFLLSDHEILSLVTHKIGTVFHWAAHTILILKEEQLRAASQLYSQSFKFNIHRELKHLSWVILGQISKRHVENDLILCP